MEMMEAPISASQGAMRSLPRKLESLLSGPKQGLRAEEKKKLRGLQADLQGLIDNYLFEPSEVESPASTASFWMKDVRDLSYDIDDFVYELAHVAVSGARIGAAQIQKPPGVKISRFPDKLKRRQWISDEISGFRTRVKEAIQRHKAYLGGCRWRPSSSSDQHSAPSPCGRAAIRLVGMDSPVKQLCGWLANDGQPEHKVASIVGTSGVGKTTLAREVYRKLGGQFECRAFVQTSRKQDMRILLTSILSQVRRHHLPDSFEVHKLLFEIKQHLQDKTYIIVIDNLWASSTWDIISHALPKGNCCSRILTTTEVDAIAQTCCADTSKYIFKKEPLSEDESRELFLGKVFGHEAGCPQVFKEVSNEIIKRSGGLPLAISTLASLLAGQPASSIEHWNYIKNSLSSDSSTNTSLEGIKQVLNLGYDNLPHDLKACMLYLCLYEEDRVIWKEDLVKQWIAEGFICAVEVAQSYFEELVSRGMIQPVDINCNDEILSCRVHHMVLHFIRYKSTEENFSIALDHSQTTIRLADKVRRLALHFGNVEYATLPMTASMRLSQVRSLAFSGLLKCMPSIVEFRFIQVLILKLWADPDNRSDNLTGSDDLNGNITEPDDLSCNLSEISELFRLRYFHLDACHMSVELPTQMKRLKDLVAWEIDADVSAVPSDIVDLPGLFFLSIPSEAHLPTDIGRMTSLRTLGVIDLSKNSTENIMCLGELTNLQDLRLTCSTLQPDNLEKNLECLGLIVQKLSNLKCVTLVPAVSSHVKTQDDVGAPNMSISWDFTIVPLSPALLQRLELSWRCCIFSSLPEWTKDLTKLVILKMAVRKVSGEDVVILKGLPSLTALSLFVWTAPIRRIIFDNEGFFVLKYFKFVCAVPCLSFLDGAMPKVRNLKLDFNANRMEQYILVAAGFERLIGLKKISIKIGGAGADECDRRSAQSVLTDAISKHPNTPIISVQWVNWKFCGDDEKSIEAQKEVWNQILGEQDVNAGESNSYLQNTVYIGMEVVSGAIGSLIPKLGMLLMEEYNLHKRVKKDVEFLRKELESMHAALIKVGEVPRDQLDRQVKLWADEVRDLSYNMEDVVDNFLIHVDDIQQPHNNSGIFKELKNKMTGLFKKGKNHHRIADAIEEIKEQLLEVSARRDRNKGVILDNPTEPIAIDPRLRALYAEATELVGIYGKRDQELMRLLSMEGDDASKNRLKKVSIVGFGGLGKTTLARAVYEKIKGDFDCQAFVPVGQNPDIKKVLRDILIDLGNPHSDLAILDANQLIKKLHEFLENKRYLVIIDDIWDEKLWEGINFAFSNRNNLGSRLITTTRIVSVSNSCCSSNNDSVYQMKPLSVDDSRRLFYKRIFPGESGCPNEFEQVSRDILKKCGGVPLAIITIASALAGGKQVKPKREWDILLQSLGSGLTEDNSLEEMRRILSFSYYNLPSHLKTCLLYLCIYPEDSKIDRDRLIWKWVAEGFVHHGDQGTSLFLVGVNYFNQLINRSMIQPIYDGIGQVHACRVHDMVLDLICNLSHEAKFVNVLDGTGNSMSSQSNVRRLSLQNQAKPLTTIMSLSRLRSITIFPLAVSIMPALTRFEVLRVLDLSDCNMGKSSRLQINLKGVGHLIHLRYLGLAGTGISELPAEIGNLQFLEVLDLESNIQLDRLPSTICKLRRLIYLKAYICEVVTGVFQNLTSIEVLTGILVSLNIIAQELGNLVRLRELQIHFKDGSSDLYEGFVKSLCNLRQIESLSIDCNSEETSFELMDLLGERWVPPVHLSEFVSWMPSKLSALRGWIKRDPSHLSNLSELILDSVKEVQQEDVEIIGGLLSLRRLRIRSTHQTQRLLVIRADGFCCMVDFALYCGSAAQIMFEPGALPRAEEVRFSLGVWVAKEDGNCGFNLGLQGNLLSLRRYVIVRIYCGGARVGEAKEAEAAVRLALKAHPNHPLIFIDMRPRIAKGAHDDDLCDYEN